MNDSASFEPDDPLARQLFAAGRDEAPSRQALAKTLSAMGTAAFTLSVAEAAQASAAVLPHAAVAGAAGGKAAATITWAIFAKWTGIGLGAGIATIAAVDAVEHLVAAKPDAAFTTGSADLSPRMEPPAAARSPALSVESPEPDPDPVRLAAPPGEAEASRARERLPTDALQTELARVDKARAALAGGRWGEAFSESQRYERDHPSGRLLLEALLIRMRAHEKMGDASEARAVARRLIGMSPTSPHASQARALLQAAGEIP